MGYRLLVLSVACAGCASTAALGVGGTAASAGGGFTLTANSEMGFRVGENMEIGVTSNMHFGNWTRAANAYRKLNEWAASGSVDCCDKFDPLLTFFKYIGLGMGYMSAWVLATNATMVGPRLRYYVQRYAPTMYFDLGAGPAGFFDEDRNDALLGIGGTTAVGYMFNPYGGVELRGTWGNIHDPQWATVTVGLVIKPKKRVLGLFGKNDLERPPPPPQPQPYPPYPPQSYPAPPLPASRPPQPPTAPQPQPPQSAPQQQTAPQPPTGTQTAPQAPAPTAPQQPTAPPQAAPQPQRPTAPQPQQPQPAPQPPTGP